MTRQRKRKVREVWISQVERRILDGKEERHVGLFVSRKFNFDDIVRVTVERLAPRRAKTGRGEWITENKSGVIREVKQAPWPRGKRRAKKGARG